MTVKEISVVANVPSHTVAALILKEYPFTKKVNNKYIIGTIQGRRVIKLLLQKKENKIMTQEKKPPIVSYKNCTDCIKDICPIVNEPYCTVYPKNFETTEIY